ncbi:hypothetical protein IWQ60_008880 [Tieghemiomyces parasiticus]|uniref:Uncharacterized protein n=1 Tax=Tieghemiomyces parasiticus TaxID=78921 RepID=A0A9W7ZWT7_9FUNG|nr:hypothetical protein IWQ60_008880 [Tieghemiomyces parasiticus]
MQCAGTFFTSALVCPACETVLAGKDEIVVTNLNPSGNYKTSILAGLRPELVAEIAALALNFWTYQVSQELAFRDMRMNQCQQDLKSREIHAATHLRQVEADLHLLKEKCEQVSCDHELEKRRAYELAEQLAEKERHIRRLQASVDQYKKTESLRSMQRMTESQPAQLPHQLSTLYASRPGNPNVNPRLGSDH